jgi:DNA polymerase
MTDLVFFSGSATPSKERISGIKVSENKVDDLLDKLSDYFKAQKDLYGSELILNQKIIDELPERKVPVVEAEPSKELFVDENLGQLKSYYHEIKGCMKCALGATRTHFVFGVGSSEADLMLIGEAPGRDEDLKGIPFVGRAGQLLTLMLQSINLKREEVFIANVLKCRPPNNRDPQPDEIEKCEPYLLKQIEMISPRLIVTLGRFASASLLRTKSALGTLREEIHNYNEVPLFVTYHPAALLRNPQLKRQAWEDLKKISEFLKKDSPID